MLQKTYPDYIQMSQEVGLWTGEMNSGIIPNCHEILVSVTMGVILNQGSANFFC